MRSENLLGAVAFERGEIGEAESRFGAALGIAHELEDSLMAARASNNLASVAHLAGRPELALSLYRNAMLSYQRLGDRRGTAETYHNLGLAFRQLGLWADADRATDEAVRHAASTGQPALVALAATGRAELHLERGEWELASTEIERATRLAAEGRDPAGVAEAGRLRGLLRLGQGDARGAVDRGRQLSRRWECCWKRRWHCRRAAGCWGCGPPLWRGEAAAGRRRPGQGPPRPVT
jgi:tetratricopeptide (TPR) repeat protein